MTHSECGDGKLCIFQTGTCADACEAGTCDSCTVGTVCNDCATSACPDCLDCRGACVPKIDSQCDENDPCAFGFICMFDQGLCAPVCAAKGLCIDPGLERQFCVSGSCCGCDDCVSACIGFR